MLVVIDTTIVLICFLPLLLFSSQDKTWEEVLIHDRLDYIL